MLKIYKPLLKDLWFREKMLSDIDTMSFNNAYGGTIPFPKERWLSWYKRWLEDDSGNYFYRYLMNEGSEFIGEIAYHLNGDNLYIADILIYSKFRNKGYGKEGLSILCGVAKENGVNVLYDDIAIDNVNAYKLFTKCGFLEEYRTNEIIMLKKQLNK